MYQLMFVHDGEVQAFDTAVFSTMTEAKEERQFAIDNGYTTVFIQRIGFRDALKKFFSACKIVVDYCYSLRYHYPVSRDKNKIDL